MTSVDSERVWLASLPHAVLGASVVFRDSAGRVLLVEPTYRDTWLLPGGTVEDGEAPADAARRETREELGFDLADRLELLVIDWVGPDKSTGRPPFCHFVFNGGLVTDAMGDQIVLPADELSDWAMCGPDDWGRLMIPRGAARLRTAVGVAADGTGARYCISGQPAG